MMQNAFNRYSVYGVGILVVGIIVTLTYQFLSYTQDDVFITYTYSRNIVEGNGFVFNIGEQVQGTTTPLWTLVMAGVYLFTDNLLMAGNLLSATLLILVIVLALMLTRDTLSPLARVVMVFLLATSPIFYISFGMETLLYCSLLLGGFVLWKYQYTLIALVLAGLLVWTRADGMILAGTFGLLLIAPVVHYRNGESVKRLLSGMLVGFLTVAPWFTFALIYFGSLTPNTFSAKLSGQTSGSILNFVLEGARLVSGLYINNPFLLVAIPFSLIGVVMGLKSPTLRPPILWLLCYTLGYSLLDVTEFWYYTPLLTVLMIVCVYSGDVIARSLLKKLPIFNQTASRYASITLVVVLISTAHIPTAISLSQPPQRTEFYTGVGQWLAENTPVDNNILLVDLGIVGYHARRQAVDSFGLIVRDMYNFSPVYAALKYRQDYAVTTYYPPWYETLSNEHFQRVYRPLFQNVLEKDPQFSPVGVYELRVPKITPSQIYQGEQLGLNCVINLPDESPLPETITGQIVTTDNLVLIRQETLPFGGDYPDIRRYTLGLEHIREQQIIETGALSVGNYIWQIDCQTEQPIDTVSILPLNTAPDYITVEAEWQDGVVLNGAWIANQKTIFSGGMLQLLLDFTLNTSEPFLIGVELIDTQGTKQAEGIFLLPMMIEGVEPEHVVSYGEVSLPVAMPEGVYTIEVNRFLDGVWTRIPLQNSQEVIVLPGMLTIHRWTPDTPLK